MENRLFTSELPTNGQESPEPHCLPSESQRGHSGRVGRSVLVGQQQGGECCPRKPTIRKSGLAPRRLGRFPFMSSVVNRCGHLPLGITKEAMSPLTCAEGPPPTDKVPGGPVEPTGEMKVYLSQKTAIFMWREAPPPPRPGLCQPYGEGEAHRGVCGSDRGTGTQPALGGPSRISSLRCAPQALLTGWMFSNWAVVSSFLIKLPS